MPNDPFYSTPAWRRVRLEILQRHNRTCRLQLVGCTIKATEVDHIIPRQLGGPSLDPNNLRAVCSWCHKQVTHRKHLQPHAEPSRNW